MRFRTKQFLVEMFGNPEGLLSFLRAYDAKLPGAPAVKKWFYRESLPVEWAWTLLAYLEIEHGAPISISKYLGE